MPGRRPPARTLAQALHRDLTPCSLDVLLYMHRTRGLSPSTATAQTLGVLARHGLITPSHRISETGVRVAEIEIGLRDGALAQHRAAAHRLAVGEARP